ncbi:hypothetical protein BGZ54_004749, partial [Gamsiella multidivaricata]
MFIQEGPHGTSVLYIPSIFISYNGDALDEKTVLLRSTEQISKSASELLNLIDPVPVGAQPKISHVLTTLGTEQEYFLIDRSLYALRPDLKTTGRTLIGNLPPKHQQMDDHYFGRVPSKVMATMSEAELELFRLGVPVKTRHNEVAPQQFELAPIFEEASLAVDHNLLTMDVLSKVAHKNKMKVLYHEKPFKGVNGSGKHCNWSMSTDKGENLLDPTVKPETNYRFLLILVSVLHAVQQHGALLRTSISSASNEHRLGACEAPPSILSIFLGQHLTEVLNSIEESRPIKNFSMPEIHTIKLGGTVLDVKMGDKPFPSDADKLAVIKKFIASTKSICFEGDGYSDAWIAEAEKRGLPNIRTCPEAFEQLLNPAHASMLTKLGIFSQTELSSRYLIMNERYAKDLLVEANTMRTLLAQQILPAVFEYRGSLAQSVQLLSGIEGEAQSPELEALKALTPAVKELQAGIVALDEAIAKLHAIHDDP